MFERSRPVKDREGMGRFAREVPYCQGCGRRPGIPCWWAGHVRTQIHHLIKRGRSDESCNLLKVCELCHRLMEGDRIRDPWSRTLLPSLQPLGIQLAVKAARDLSRWDAERLRVLYHQELPPLLPIPHYLQTQWVMNRGR